MSGLTQLCKEDTLIWFPEKGVGYYPVNPEDAPYDASYFERYQKQADTEIGRALTEARVELVNKYTKRRVLDIGIGSGQFLEAHGNAWGFDVNPVAIDWLKELGRFGEPGHPGFTSFTFWDSLEHIECMEEILVHIKEYAFVSIPIFKSAEHCLSSKHFRKDEHYWYFTDEGFISWFKAQGFECLENNDMETQIGREDIRTYVFKRISCIFDEPGI